ncbi:hypothetical protein IWQ61_000780 [Dispira simplex]|nr:hypothetical protein IWQ61_000780 [Dispira simplex]
MSSAQLRTHTMPPVGRSNQEPTTNVLPSLKRVSNDRDLPVEHLELAIEHFGFRPMDCIKDIAEALNQSFCSSTALLESLLEAEMGPCTEVKQGTYSFETLLHDTIGKSIATTKLYLLRNIFTAPEGLVISLPHYEGNPCNAEDEFEEDLDRKLDIMRKKLQAAYCFNAILSQRLQSVNTELGLLNAAVDSLKPLEEASQKDNVSVLGDPVKSFVSQLTAVHKDAEQLQESYQTFQTECKRIYPLDQRMIYLQRMAKTYINGTLDDTLGSLAD